MLFVIAFAFTTLCTGCGGGSGSSKPPPTIDPQERDRLAVDAAVLQASDLPGVWNTNRPASTASESLPTRDDVLTIADVCFPTPDGITSTTAREYLSGPTLGHVLVRGVVEAHRDAASLSSALATLSPATVKACVPELVHRVFGDGVTLGAVTVDSSSVDGVGDERGGVVVSIPLSGSGGDFSIGVDIVYARVDRFRATCTVVNFDSPPDHALCVEGLKAMVHRLGQ